MSNNFIKRQFTRLENKVTKIGGTSERNFLRDRVRKREQEMNTELPNMSNKAREGYNIVNQLSQQTNPTDGHVSQALNAAEPIKDYYQNYQTVMTDNTHYNTLTSEFTKQRNAWWQHKTQRSTSTLESMSSAMAFGMAPASAIRELSEDDIANLRRDVIRASKDFLRKAKADLLERVNPGSVTRHEIAQDEQMYRTNAAQERWKAVITGTGMEIPEIPASRAENWDTPTPWGTFASMKYDELIAEKQLEPDSKDAELIADIMIGGKSKDIEESERDSEKYQGYMRFILEKFEAFKEAQENQEDQ